MTSPANLMLVAAMYPWPFVAFCDLHHRRSLRLRYGMDTIELPGLAEGVDDCGVRDAAVAGDAALERSPRAGNQVRPALDLVVRAQNGGETELKVVASLYRGCHLQLRSFIRADVAA